MQVERDKPPYGFLWLAIFIFTAAVAMVVQFVVLGPVFPEWSDDHGLLLSTDSIAYHNLAVLLAERIHAEGWAVWEIAPGAQFPVGFTALAYALVTPKPWVLIPIAAAATAFAGSILIRIGLFFTDDWRIAALAATPYVLFPSASFWYSQLLKDTYFNLGVLMFCYGWMILARIETWRTGWRGPVLGFALVLLSFIIMSVIRPYALSLMNSAAILLAACSILILLIQARRRMLTFGRTTIAIVTIAVCAATLTASRERLVAADTLPLNLSFSGGQVDLTGRLRQAEAFWEWTSWLPKAVDRKLAVLSGIRHGYNFSGKAPRSAIDSEVEFTNAPEVLLYVPRAAQIGFLAPFPSHWFGQGSTAATTAMRRVSMLEMLFTYAALMFVPFAFWRWRSRGEIWILASFSAAILLTYSIAIPNVGTLYRIRFPYLMLFLTLGILMACTLWQQFRGAHDAAFAPESEGSEDTRYPTPDPLERP